MNKYLPVMQKVEKYRRPKRVKYMTSKQNSAKHISISKKCTKSSYLDNSVIDSMAKSRVYNILCKHKKEYKKRSH